MCSSNCLVLTCLQVGELFSLKLKVDAVIIDAKAELGVSLDADAFMELLDIISFLSDLYVLRK